MATVAATRTRYTPEDLLTITDRPMPELINGELVERETGQKADGIAATILGLVIAHVKSLGLGLVNGAQGSYQIFPDDPTKVRIPDVSFTRRDRVPATGPATGHGKVAPDLIVEVISPHETVAELTAKVEDYLAAGVPLIWVADPVSRTMQVLRGDRSGHWLRPSDTLDGGEVLPGFQCRVSALFE